MPYRCRERGCAEKLSVRTGTALEASNLGHQTWVIAIYQPVTDLRGVSSLKLHRDLDDTQGSSWFLGQRIREGWRGPVPVFDGSVEADETYVGGKRNRMHSKRRKAVGGRGTAGKMVVAECSTGTPTRSRRPLFPIRHSLRLQSDHIRGAL